MQAPGDTPYIRQELQCKSHWRTYLPNSTRRKRGPYVDIHFNGWNTEPQHVIAVSARLLSNPILDRAAAHT
jgi:hypothetical protein